MNNGKFTGILVAIIALAAASMAGIELITGTIPDRHLAATPIEASDEANANSSEKIKRQTLQVTENRIAKMIHTYSAYMASESVPMTVQDDFQRIREAHRTDMLLLKQQLGVMKVVSPKRIMPRSYSPTAYQQMVASAASMEGALASYIGSALSSNPHFDIETKDLLSEVQTNALWSQRLLLDRNR